jgi:hypothetical protein
MRLILNIILIVVMICLMDSCSKIQLKPDLSKNYKMDIFIKNKEFESIGMIALPSKPLYTIEFEAEEKISYISFRTCSREIISEDPRVGVSRRKYSINYKPNEIEAAGNCPAIVSAFNENLMYSVGYLDFYDPSTTLPAINVCGSKTEEANGVSVCQERSSSIERIKFNTEVLTSPDVGCELESGNRGLEFTYKIKAGYCIYAFMETKEPFRIHRLTTFGYDEVQVRR